MKSKLNQLLALATLLYLALAMNASAQTAAFTYQGRLVQNGAAANGLFDFQFALFPDSFNTNNQVDTTISVSSLGVTNGLFATELAFPLGASDFNGADRWLQIWVRPSLVGSNYAALVPRQRITSSPYAVQAANAASAASVAAGNITGTLPLAQLPGAVLTNGSSNVYISGTFSGNGGGVTNLSFSANSEGLIKLSGAFMVSASPAAGSSPSALKAADVNGDGKVDLICANNTSFSGTLTVLTNNGKGDYSISSANAVRPGPVAVEVADVNGDGKPDLISASFSDSSLTILTNNGVGGFGWSSVIIDGHPSAYSVVAADMNGDGKPDLIIPKNTGSVLLYINGGNGGFGLTTVPGAGGSPRATEVADVNRDGRPDLICVNYLAAGTVTILTNNGSGGFAVSSAPSVGSFPYAIKVRDINGDGTPDLITPNYSGDSVSVLTNNGNGAFALLATIGVGTNPTAVEAADIDNDGGLDLICANLTTDRLTILLNRGPNGFMPTPSPSLNGGSYSVVAADVNADGKIDLIRANSAAGSVSILQNVPSIYGAFFGSGSELVSLDAAQLSMGTVPDSRLGENVARTNQVWLLGGNAGTTAGANYLGTSDTQPLEFKVGGGRGWRLEPTASDASHSGIVNVVGGSSANGVGAGIYGATVAGGGAANYSGISAAHRVEADFGTIGGGGGNLVQNGATYSTVSGGWLNTIQPNANFATIPGGTQNSATNYAFAAGSRAKAIHTGSFVWADSTPADFASTANNQFNVRAGGGMRLAENTSLDFGSTGRQMLNLWSTNYGIGVQSASLYFRCNNGGPNDGFIWYKGGGHNDGYASAGGGTELMHLVSGGLYVNGTLASTSDRNAKENFQPVDVGDVLDKVVALPIARWNYKNDATTPHLGPVAQDFYSAFNVGPDDKHITTVDESGVALAAIQGLNLKLEAARAENAELKERLARLEKAMARLLD